MGAAYAGSAAVAENASTVFFNPAGMAWLENGKVHLSVGIAAIQPSAKFTNNGSQPVSILGAPISGGNGGDAGSLAWVPDAYVVVPIDEQISFGLGMGAPFGLKTEYDSNWIGRFMAVKSDVKTLNLNPSLSYKHNETTAFGFGLNFQKMQGEFTRSANYAGLAEGHAKLTGSDTAWGYNFGAMFQVSPATRVGLSYRSAIKYRLEGSADLSRTGNASWMPCSPPLDALARWLGVFGHQAARHPDLQRPA